MTSSRPTPPPAVHLLAGSVCGGFSSLVLQPLDVIKTRLQGADVGAASHHQPMKLTGTAVRSYSVGIPVPITARSTVGEIIRHHGVRGLWHGTSATLARTLPGVGTYFFMLSQTKEFIAKVRPRRDGSGLTACESIMAGASARSATGLLYFPLTLLKARLESGLWGYQGIKGGLSTMYRTEGFVGMYKGVGATMMRDAPYSGAFVMAYEMNKGIYRRMSGQETPSLVANLAVAVGSGMFACVITHPFDVIKTLVQVHPQRYASTLGAWSETFTSRGVLGFYKGFGARLARKSAMGGITWTLYEQIVTACTNSE